MKEVYVIHTSREPSFLDMDAGQYDADVHQDKIERNIGMHSGFVQEVRKQYPDFDVPYVTLTPVQGRGTRAQIVHDDYVGPAGPEFEIPAQANLEKWHGVAWNDKIMSFPEFIEDCVENGVRQLTTEPKKPVTAIVEFSAEELYPEVMAELAGKYDIKKIRVD